MGKITKQQTKLHDEAMKLVRSDKDLTDDEVSFVYENYNPMASHNVGKGAIFFTPVELARNFAIFAEPKGTVIDLCAGIGVLSWAVLKHDYGGFYSRSHLCGDIKRLVAIENNPEFVEIGKRLLPEVEWYCGSVFDLSLLSDIGYFDCAISNPPYGNIPSKQDGDWLTVKGPAQWMVMEVAMRMAYNAGLFIIPERDTDYDLKNREYRNNRSKDRYLRKFMPGLYVNPMSIDYIVQADEFKWTGASPRVSIASLDNSDVEWDRPFGLWDVIGECYGTN